MRTAFNVMSKVLLKSECFICFFQHFLSQLSLQGNKLTYFDLICSGQMSTACFSSLYCFLVACTLPAEQLVSLSFPITNGGWLIYNSSLNPVGKDEQPVFPFHIHLNLVLEWQQVFWKKEQGRCKRQDADQGRSWVWISGSVLTRATALASGDGKGWLLPKAQGAKRENVASRAGASPPRAPSHCTQARQTGQAWRWQLGSTESPDCQVNPEQVSGRGCHTTAAVAQAGFSTRAPA